MIKLSLIKSSLWLHWVIATADSSLEQKIKGKKNIKNNSERMKGVQKEDDGSKLCHYAVMPASCSPWFSFEFGSVCADYLRVDAESYFLILHQYLIVSRENEDKDEAITL